MGKDQGILPPEPTVMSVVWRLGKPKKKEEEFSPFSQFCWFLSRPFLCRSDQKISYSNPPCEVISRSSWRYPSFLNNRACRRRALLLVRRHAQATLVVQGTSRRNLTRQVKQFGVRWLAAPGDSVLVMSPRALDACSYYVACPEAVLG